MNTTNIVIVGIFALIFLVNLFYLFVKKHKVKIASKMFANKQYQEIIQWCEKESNKKFIGQFNCDLYTAKSLALQNKYDELTNHLRKMFKKEYSNDNKKEYLSLYFHFFIIHENLEMVNELLNQIEILKNDKLTKYCTWTKEVLFDGRNDLIETMKESIDNKDYYGFPLGVVVYLIAIQNCRLGNEALAFEYLRAGRDAFRPDDFYVKDVDRMISELSKKFKIEEE